MCGVDTLMAVNPVYTMFIYPMHVGLIHMTDTSVRYASFAVINAFFMHLMVM